MDTEQARFLILPEVQINSLNVKFVFSFTIVVAVVNCSLLSILPVQQAAEESPEAGSSALNQTCHLNMPDLTITRPSPLDSGPYSSQTFKPGLVDD